MIARDAAGTLRTVPGLGRRVAAVVCLGPLLLTALPIAAAGQFRDDAPCVFAEAELPRTPDAVEHWYAQCGQLPTRTAPSGGWSVPDRMAADESRCARDEARLPRTPDAVERWFANCVGGSG